MSDQADPTSHGAEPGDAQPDDVDTLAVPVAELRPALEAILMVSDEPLD